MSAGKSTNREVLQYYYEQISNDPSVRYKTIDDRLSEDEDFQDLMRNLNLEWPATEDSVTSCGGFFDKMTEEQAEKFMEVLTRA